MVRRIYAQRYESATAGRLPCFLFMFDKMSDILETDLYRLGAGPAAALVQFGEDYLSEELGIGDVAGTLTYDQFRR